MRRAVVNQTSTTRPLPSASAPCLAFLTQDSPNSGCNTSTRTSGTVSYRNSSSGSALSRAKVASTSTASSSPRRPLGFWVSKENQRGALISIGSKLGIKPGDFSAWYNISANNLRGHGARGLLDRYDNSISKMLQAVFPEHLWDITKFSNKPRNIWASTSNQRNYLIAIGGLLGVKDGDLNGWYNVSYNEFLKKGGRGIIARHNSSFLALLRDVFPEHSWDPTRLANKPRNYWSSLENQRAFLQNLGRKLGIKDGDFSAWYGIAGDQIAEEGGRALLEHHHNSISEVLMSVFSEHKWDLSKFLKKPRNYWKSPSNQREFMVELGKKLGISEGDFEAWYKVSSEDLGKQGAIYIFVLHNSSISTLLKAVFPEHSWDLSKFSAKPRNFWSTSESQRTFLVELGKKFGIQEGEFDKWLEVRSEDISREGGSGLLVQFGGSLGSLLKATLPEHDWTSFETRRTNL